MKKLIAVLIAVMMLLAVAVVMTGCSESGTQGTEAPKAHTHDIGETKNVEFKAWDGAAISEDGTYNLYLENDLAATKQVVLGDLKAEKDITINLCLNGKKWTSDVRAAVIGTGVTLNICNCSETESTIIGKGDTVASRGGTFLVYENGALNVYENVNLTCDNSQGRIKYAGVVDLKGKMGIYGGTITGCEVARIANASGGADTTTGQGGAIAINTGAELYMKDGLITGGTACTGANIRMEGASTFTMEGGKITNGYSKYYVFNGTPSGGNAGGVFVEGATFIMKGGEISGNKCDNKGGAIIANGEATVELYGDAKIINNESTHADNAGGLHVNNAKSTITLNGTPTIYDNKNASGTSNLFLLAGEIVEIGDLKDTAKIGVTVNKNAEGAITDKKAPAACFSCDVEGYQIVADANGILSIAAK